MTSPADMAVQAHLGGTDPATGNVLTYQAVPILARTIFANYDGRQPFYTNYGSTSAANSAATYDAVTGIALNTAVRHIDPYGEVAELHKLVKLLWYWLMDGAPTGFGPLGSSTSRIPTYITLANQLRPWPVGFTGAAAGEPTQAYPAYPPTTATPLDSFMAQTNTKAVAQAKAQFHGVQPVVRHQRPRHRTPEHVVAHAHSWNPADDDYSTLTPIPEWAQAPKPPGPHQYFGPPSSFGPSGPVGPEHLAAAAGQSVGRHQGGLDPATRLDATQQPISSAEDVARQVIDKLQEIERRLNQAGL